MTRLEALIKVINSDYSDNEIKEIILNNFSNQDANEFNIDGEIFFVLDSSEIEEKQSDYHENRIFDMICNIEDSEFREYASFISERGVLNGVLNSVLKRKSDEFKINGLDDIEYVHPYCIYQESQKTLF